MAPKRQHRERIVGAAATLFRRGGYASSGLNDIVALSGAPKGSLYHYFPDGKEQIGAAALAHAAARVTATLEDLERRHKTGAALVKAYGKLLAGWLEASGWRDGCPITTTLLETAPESARLTETGRNAFEAWSAIVARVLVRDGVPARRAARLASVTISVLEGALIQARVQQSARPLTDAAEEMASLFASAHA